jgi:hypothetical protein
MSLKSGQAGKIIICALFATLMYCSLFFGCSLFLSVKAEPSAQLLLVSQGNIIYNSLNTSQNSNAGTNWASIPSKWSGDTNQIGDRPADIIYPSDSYNGYLSIKLQQTEDWRAEVNGPWIRIYPGDRVVMRCWIKTTSGKAYLNSGSRIGWDYYTEDGRINGPSSEAEAEAGTAWNLDDSYADENQANFVSWGQTDWVLSEWDVIVPAYVTGDGWLKREGDTPLGVSVEPDGIMPWMQIMGENVKINAGYFANFELYIYRNGAWL